MDGRSLIEGKLLSDGIPLFAGRLLLEDAAPTEDNLFGADMPTPAGRLSGAGRLLTKETRARQTVSVADIDIVLRRSGTKC